MNTDRVLVVFGSALTSLSPRDVDVVCEGDFGAEEEKIVRQWARERGLGGDLPLDVTLVKPWRGVRDNARAEITLPTPYRGYGKHETLRGEVDVSWCRSVALPAQIRAAESVAQLIEILGDPARAGDGRMATLGNPSRGVARDFCSYTQGRLALQNAIAKCEFWDAAELLDPRVRMIRMFAEFGAADCAIDDLYRFGQAGGGDGGVNWVRLDGIQTSYGPHLGWRNVLPMKRIRRREARANGRRRAMSVAPIC